MAISSSTNVQKMNDGDLERERLILLCALDRARVELLLRPTKPALPPEFRTMQNALRVASLMPGPVGRWSRSIFAAARFLPTVIRYGLIALNKNAKTDSTARRA